MNKRSISLSLTAPWPTRAPFLNYCLAHVEGPYRQVETLEDEFARWFHFGHHFDRRVHLRVNEDLAILCYVTQAAGEICNCAGHRVLESPLEADATECRVTMSDSDPKAKLPTMLTPFHFQLSDLITHLHRHLHGPHRRIGTRQRIVE